MTTNYNANDIEVLEGLEPVRHRPGMYIGGTDETALHHLVNEIFDNAMDEVVAKFATIIDVECTMDGYVIITDNGRGIPVQEHPKYPGKSAVEIIFTVLHSGGKFKAGAYETSGGLHGVGSAVVNALTEHLVVEVVKDKKIYKQEFSRGEVLTKLEIIGKTDRPNGTTVKFKHDKEIFGDNSEIKPSIVYNFIKSKSFLYKGVKINWKSSFIDNPIENENIPLETVFNYKEGIADFAKEETSKSKLVSELFFGEIVDSVSSGKLEWVLGWDYKDAVINKSYCNTIPTQYGGTHENGFKNGILKALKSVTERLQNKKSAEMIIMEDVFYDSIMIISCFISNPQFQGQTKDKLQNTKEVKFIETQIKDKFEQWLASNTNMANALIEFFVDRAEYRIKRKEHKKEQKRKSATKKLRLPGKLADCSSTSREGTELFLVEGDSAGGSAKQGRDRKLQAILPLKGKILNVASSTKDKIHANQEIKDMVKAIGCGIGKTFEIENCRYDRIIIMTDADVDGSHIATLLITFFYQEMRELITNGMLYLAIPPLYRLANNNSYYYAMDDEELEKIKTTKFAKNAKIDISRFKGLGEMTPAQLKETTMNPKNRSLIKVSIPDGEEGINETIEIVDSLMGKNPEKRYNFIQENASFAEDIDI